VSELKAHEVAQALADTGCGLDVRRMTREELLAVPFREDRQNEAGPFTSIIIVPLDDIHESGWRKMDFIGCRDRFPVCRLSGQSDNLSLLGIGGRGRRLRRLGKDNDEIVYDEEEVPCRHGWQIDCLPTSGLLHLWDDTGTLSVEHLLNETDAYSTFDLYVNPKDPR
jgi:hypothetical protein